MAKETYYSVKRDLLPVSIFGLLAIGLSNRLRKAALGADLVRTVMGGPHELPLARV